MSCGISAANLMLERCVSKNSIDEIKGKIEKQTQKIQRSVSRMSYLIDSTLNLSALESGNVNFSPASLDLISMIEDIANTHTEIGAKPVTFHLALEALPEHFSGDKTLIEHIFMNLFSNAIKYSGSSCEISVTSSCSGDSFSIAVADNGIGISESNQQKLFEKFFRVEHSTTTAGTGIGLYLVKSFVELHGGAISVASASEGGTIFTMIFPLNTIQEKVYGT